MIFVNFLISTLLFLGALGHPQNRNRKFHTCEVPGEWFEEAAGNISSGIGIGINNFGRWKWPGAVVKYELHNSLSANDRNVVQASFNDYHEKTCIRFVPRSPGESAFVSIETDNNVCGLAHVCRTGGYQFAKFGGGCRDMVTMVHELGHSLCLFHEHDREDRDEYLQFNSCKPEDIPGKHGVGDNDLRGSLYDYGSIMHYQCGWCPGGWPKMSGVNTNVCESKKGLSVIDADRMNDYYDCGGCFGHRWKPVETLSEEDKQGMWALGETMPGEPIYLCRGFVDGEIAAGKYWREKCYVPYKGREYILTSKAQVFIRPNNGANYRLANVGQGKPVPVGRTNDGHHTAYVAVAKIQPGWSWERSIGNVFENDMGTAYFPYWGGVVEVTDFQIMVCG